MARAYSADYAQWLQENNFSQADEKLLLKTVTGRMFIWFLLSCIPGAGFFVLPLFMNAWTWRKIIRKKTFEPRPGLLYGFCALAMYLTFIAIIPWILWALAKRNQWGTGIRRLIKKGKIGNGTGAVRTDADSDDASQTNVPHQEQKRRFPWWILVLVPVILVILLVILVGAEKFFGLTNRKEPAAAETAVLHNYEGAHVSTVTTALENWGIRYKITYVTEPGKAPGTVIRHEPAAGTALEFISCVELFVAQNRATVPDFSAATSVEEVQNLAEQNDLQLELIYTDPAAGLTFESIPDGMVIDRIECDFAPGAEVEPGSTVTVTICLKADYKLTGDWHHAEYNYGSLYLAQYHFNADGTFSYYYMGYMPVDYETDLYTYGTYWDGAMGADDYDGTYTLSGSQLILSFEYWDWGCEAYIQTVEVYQIAVIGGVLEMRREGNDYGVQYQAGSQPDRDAVLSFSMTGSWYALGTPINYEDFRSMAVYTFLFYEDGTFESGHYCYQNGGSGWYFPGAGSTFTGEYSFDGTNLVLHYTAELQLIINNDGDYMGTESVPVDDTEAFVLTVENGEITDVAHNSAGLRYFIRFNPSPYVNVDIMGAPLDHANQLFP